MSALFALVATGALPLFAAPQKPAPSPNAGFNDGINRADPNFVKASLLIMSPGDELYSCAGHSCIRLECPKFNLDYCFTYESEASKNRIIPLLAGKLKMGMFSVPTDEYLQMFKEEGREVIQYKLNLPPEVKQRLWKYLDGKVEEGILLPDDVLRRGCAQSILEALRNVLPPYQFVIKKWPIKYSKKTRRELVESVVNDQKWNRLLLHTFSGMELDRDVPLFEKVVTPVDLVETLSIAKVFGKPVLAKKGETIVAESGESRSPSVLTPLVIMFVVMALALVNSFTKALWLDIVFLVLQSFLGAGLSYLVFVSDLFGTNWNWLLIPFNLLPLIFWKWRAKWAIWFAALLVLWEVGMIAYPHRLTDPAYLVLVAAFIVMYARIGLQGIFCRSIPVDKPNTRSCADIYEKIRRDNEAARKERGR